MRRWPREQGLLATGNWCGKPTSRSSGSARKLLSGRATRPRLDIGQVAGADRNGARGGREPRVEGVVGSWNTIWMLLRSGSSRRACGRMAPISSPSTDVGPKFEIQQAHHHHRCGGLAAAEFADETDALAVTDGEADAVNGAEHFRLDGGLRETVALPRTAVAPWRGYSLTSFSTRRSGFAKSSTAGVSAAAGAPALPRQLLLPATDPATTRQSSACARIIFSFCVGVRGPRKDIRRLRRLHHAALLIRNRAVA